STGWDRTYGALLTFVEPGSPADQAGVQEGDIVASAGGHQVEDGNELKARLKSYPAKAPFEMQAFRDGKLAALTVTPTEFPAKMAEELSWKRLGFKLKGAAGGLAIAAIRPGSNAARIGLAPGDVVLKLNGRVVSSESEWR